MEGARSRRCQIQLSVYWPFSGGPSLAAKYSTLSDLPKHNRNKQPNSSGSGYYRDCIVVRESPPTKHCKRDKPATAQGGPGSIDACRHSTTTGAIRAYLGFLFLFMGLDESGARREDRRKSEKESPNPRTVALGDQPSTHSTNAPKQKPHSEFDGFCFLDVRELEFDHLGTPHEVP
jgi:hypothetical protein